MNYIEKLFNLKDKVALITGGGGVLAGTFSGALAKAGMKIVLLDIRTEKAEAVASNVRNEGGEAIALQTDVLNMEALQICKENVLEKYKKIDVLINAAGGNMPGATIGPENTVFDLNTDDFKKVIDLNLYGTVIPSIIFGEVMAKQKYGSIINISSMAAMQSLSRVVGYSAAKAAVSNFTQWMALEMASKFGDKIRVNAIAPGFFIGDQNRDLLLNKDGSYTDRSNTILKKTPMGRFGKAEELIGSVLYLSGDAASFVTGIVLPIDGGFSSYSGV